MKNIVVDASVIIDHLKGKTEHFNILIAGIKENNLQLYIPTAVLVEVLVGYEFLQEKELKKIKRILSHLLRIPLTEEIAMLAAKIGRENRLGFIGTVDLVAAASTITIDGELATHNIKHFKAIPKLHLFDFKKLKTIQV